MTKAEKAIFSRVYGCVNRMTVFGPSNPCDIGGLSKAVNDYRSANKRILNALANLNYGEYEEAIEEIAKAEAILGIEVSA